jgi:uncharacterized protein YkwD
MRLTVSLLALSILAACTTQTMQSPTATSTATAPALAAAPAATSDAGLIALMNDYRASQGRAPLAPAASLDAAALAHARDMTQNGFFSHNGSGGSTVGSRTRAAGCSWTGVSENIAQGQTTPSQAMTTWIASDGHRRNILGSYTQFGEARVGNTWVAVFASGC